MANPEIAYLGPPGTYSQEAAIAFAERLGLSDFVLYECNTFEDVFDSVERGRCDYGVVPTENSLEGAVTEVLDRFAFNSTAEILGEEIIDVHHCLMIHEDASIEEVDTIASHPQGIAQCRRFISRELPGRKIITTSSTAESARLAAENKHIAGISNALAAELYKVRIYEQQIGDHLGNQTSFSLIAPQGSPAIFFGDVYKTSLALFLKVNVAGALLMILSEFAFANINLNKIQSRPTKQALGDYMFFIDIEGSVNDPEVQTALNCLRLKLREVKILGSYPV